MAYELLIVDDEQKVLDFVRPFLEEEGYVVRTATNGREALRIARELKPDLIVLDWMMPQMNGLEVCTELRKFSDAGIIMLTARTEEADKLVGLEIGADDYMTKPFSLRELAARIRSVLRRVRKQEEHPGSQLQQRGDLTISHVEYRVWRGDEELLLTPTEYKLLTTLADRPGVVYSRLQLLQLALPDDLLNDERTVDAHISRLRKKVEEDPAHPAYIQTVYGFGYRFSQPGKEPL